MLSRGGRAAAQRTPDSWGVLWNFLKDPKLFLPGVVEKVNSCWSRSLQKGRCPRVALWPLQWLQQAWSWVIHVAGDSFLTQPPHFLRVFCESCPRVGLFYSVTDHRWVIHVPLRHCNQHRSSPSGTWTHSFLWAVLLCLWWIGGGVSLCLGKLPAGGNTAITPFNELLLPSVYQQNYTVNHFSLHFPAEEPQVQRDKHIQGQMPQGHIATELRTHTQYAKFLSLIRYSIPCIHKYVCT